MNTENEVWKEIEGFEGKYSVSNCGRVWNNKDNLEVAQVVTGIPQYKYVNLQPYEGKRKLVRVHRLVAKAFLEWDKKYNVVDHIDRDKFNNHVSNLRWTDTSGNQKNKEGSKYIGEEHIKDFALRYENPEAAYSHLYASLASGLSEGEAIDRYEKHLAYGMKRTMVEWEGKQTYLLEICNRFGVEYDFIKQRMDNGWDIWNAIYNIPHDTGKYGFCIQSKTGVGIWFPTKSYFAEVHSQSLLKYLDDNLLYEDLLVKDGKDGLRQTIRGVTGTIVELCKHFNVSESAVSSRMTKKGMSLEEALFAPRGRVKRISINGKYKSPKDWYTSFGIDPKAANNYKSKYSKTFKETLEYYGVDTLGMTFSEI